MVAIPGNAGSSTDAAAARAAGVAFTLTALEGDEPQPAAVTMAARQPAQTRADFIRDIIDAPKLRTIEPQATQAGLRV